MTTLPRALVDFGHELETAIARDLAARRSRRRALVVRVAAMAAAAAMVVVVAGVPRELTGRGPSVVERAAAALAAPPGSIVHIRMVATQDNGDGTSVSWESESWQATYTPRPRRLIERVVGGPAAESAMSGNGIVGIYDAVRNAIYLARESELVEGVQPKPMLKPEPKPQPGPAQGSNVKGGPEPPAAQRWDGLPASGLRSMAPPRRSGGRCLQCSSRGVAGSSATFARAAARRCALRSLTAASRTSSMPRRSRRSSFGRTEQSPPS